MKKIVLLITITALFLGGCSDWLDVNKDPNVPTDVNTELILPAAEASIAVRLGGNLFNVTGFFAQYWTQAPEANQYNSITTYDLRTDFMDNDYTEMFAGALNDLERIRTKSVDAEDWGNYLVATTLRVYAYQILIDMFDQVPFTEALKGTEFPQPKWDNGQTVYAALLAEIDEAKSKLNSDSEVANTDLILDGSLDEWIGFANALKLKLLMRESDVVNVTSQVNALMSEGMFMTQDVAFSGFQNEVNKRNPWYETTKQLNTDANHVATVNIIRFMASKSDPRIGTIFNLAANSDTYEGMYPALKEIELGHLTGDYSRPFLSPTQPVYLFTMAELHLFMAEAELMLNNSAAAAKPHFEAAIDASLALHGLDADPTLYNAPGSSYYFDETASQNALHELIFMQKWVSLCAVNNYEAWCEMRRSDVPKYFGNMDDFGDGSTYVAGQYLDPAKNLLPDGVYYPYRLPYPDAAKSTNENTPSLTGTTGFTTKVWWDTK
ncbi:SusD/RagB family nutrient-binding outer membrane lipoprotein [Saccharicrinis sp. FJH62]|uniref:SusD/RagB family nutrient-binding outer membrane lipoprotein n=1 Tax=Saccharicrinis sp. FJH62 TaxID=3344657 RepID=UPI0035D51A74